MQNVYRSRRTATGHGSATAEDVQSSLNTPCRTSRKQPSSGDKKLRLKIAGHNRGSARPLY